MEDSCLKMYSDETLEPRKSPKSRLYEIMRDFDIYESVIENNRTFSVQVVSIERLSDKYE